MKPLNTFQEVPKFTDQQIKKQVQKQIEFLAMVHPALMDFESYNLGAVEIRPLKRMKHLKFIQSYVAWHLEPKDVESLEAFNGLTNGKEFCVYFSGFAFDYDRTTFDDKGKVRKKGRINNDNALYTTILPMDFDNMTYNDFTIEKQRLMDLGIETVDIFTGHGFQSFILLSHRVTDTDIYKKFTTLMISKGFRVDEALVDAARLLRMPFTFNNKTFTKGYTYAPEIIPTTDINYTDKRYHVTDVFRKINSLPDIIPMSEPLTDIDIQSINVMPITETIKKTENKKAKEQKQIEIKTAKEVRLSEGKSLYPMLNYERLPEPIQKMLMGTQDGMRNDVMLFIIPFLRNSLGLPLASIKQVMITWGGLCKPAINESTIIAEVDRLYGYDLKGKYGKYTQNMAKAYGYLVFEEYKRDHKITIPNVFFDDVKVMSDGAFRIYLALKLAEKRDGVETFTLHAMLEAASVSRSTLLKNIKDLVTLGYLCKKRQNRRMGEEYVYYINPHFNRTKGYTALENATVSMMLKTLTDGEMKLYAYLCFMIGASQTSCWASQKYLAKAIGKSGQSVISRMTDELNNKDFIRKETVEKDGWMHSSYTLIY